MSSSSDPQEAKAQAAATVEDVTGGFTANESIPETDTGTTERGAAADAGAGGESIGDLASKSNSAAASRHEDKDPDVEPPRVSNDQKPDITDERAPTESEAKKSAPTFDTDEVPLNTKQSD